MHTAISIKNISERNARTAFKSSLLQLYTVGSQFLGPMTWPVLHVDFLIGWLH